MSIKSVLKKKLNSGDRINSEILYKSIQDFKYVSFDLFDTLVKRNVAEPSDIFSIMEMTVGKGFRKKRMEAEKKARAELGKTEITMDDIYRYFPKFQRKSLIELEIKTEFDSIVANSPVAEVYSRCVEAKKIVFIVSDMYLSEETVKELLSKSGFNGYKALYLSSSQQKVKSNGSLFRYLLEREGICAKELVHIGDSQKGDYGEPRKLGISAVKIPRYFKNIEFRGDYKNNTIELNYLNCFINNTFPYTEDSYYQFGWSQFGKLLYGYTHWIYEEAVKRGIKKLFFFSRDGYIMKQAYEICVDDEEIETKYLEVSRRSLRGAVLWMDCSFDIILKLLIDSKLVSLESIFDRIGLDIQNYTDPIKRNGLSMYSVFDCATIKHHKGLKKLLKEITPDIIENSRKEYEILSEYFEINDVLGKFGVVDIGYTGGMQCHMQQILTRMGTEHDITGLYLTVTEFYTKNMLPEVRLELNGYLFDFKHDRNAVDTRSSFVGLFETLFLEHGGSVKRYVRDGGMVVAERYPYEYEIDGKLTEDFFKVRKIQKGALDFVSFAKKDKLLRYLKCKPDEYFDGLYKIGTDPSLDELNLLGDILFYDEGVTLKLAAPKGMLYYIVHPGQMKLDFLQCRWKTGFMKRLFKIKLPYQKIYLKLKAWGK